MGYQRRAMTTSVSVAGAPERIEFSTTDSDRAIAYFNDVYRTSMRITGARDGYRYHHSRVDGGSFAINNVGVPLHIGVRRDPLDRLIIVRIGVGRIERECGGVNERFFSGDVFVDAAPGVPANLRMHGVQAQTVMLDPAALAKVAATSPARVAGSIRLTSYQPRSAAAALHWQRTIAYLSEVLTHPELVAEPLIRGTAGRLLAATVLTTFPNTAVIDPTAQDRNDATSTTLRRAIAFIEQHPHTDISVADIAAAANVSIRAVQIAFRRQLDTTPMAYLRTVRLDRAHHDLLATDPAQGATVTDIAARWGFSSNSRFAARYRGAYGVTPRHTLHS
jgi:AraC-like DNA-binding protein